MLFWAYPPGWMDRYFAQDYVHIDPIVRRSKCDPSPFLWSEAAPFVRAEHSALASRMFGEAAEFNLKAGFVVPMITLGGVDDGVAGRRSGRCSSEAHGMIAMICAYAIGRAIELRDREKKREALRAHAARGGMPEVGRRRQNRMGNQRDPEHLRAYGRQASGQRAPQAWRRKSRPGRGERHPLGPYWLIACCSGSTPRARLLCSH